MLESDPETSNGEDLNLENEYQQGIKALVKKKILVSFKR